MAGLLDGLFGGALGGGDGGGSGILGALTDWNSLSPTIGGMFSNNQNAMLGLGLGLMSGDPKMAMQGALLGRTSDTAAAKQRREDQEKQQQAASVEAYAKRAGMDPTMISLLKQNPTLATSVIGDRMKKQLGADGPEEYGLNPQYGVDAQGNPVLLQLGKSGSAKQTQLPEGVQLSREPIRLDAGTHFVLLDPITRQPIGQIPKNLAGAEAEKAVGKAQGEAQATLGTDLAAADRTIQEIDALVKHPGLDSIVGPLDQYRGSTFLGSEGRDALARYNQLKGRAFLQAYAILKGGGPITNIEGQKAEDAMARMNRALSEDDFRTALKDFRDAVAEGMQKLRQRAGQGGSGAPSAGGRGGTTSSGLNWSLE